MKLLLVEDEKALSKALVAILKHNNYSVDAVYNGLDALDYLDTGLYDGAIIDIMMPVMDGLTLLKTMRQKGINIPVIMLTAKSEVEDKVLGLDLGADDYLTKPFDTKELLARIRAMIRRKESHVDDIISFNDVKLNRSLFELSYNDNKVTLNNKEYQMLELLMLSPGVVISIDKFMEKIWGYDSETEISVVWVYVSYIRKKLKQINAPINISSNRNLGYFLVKTNEK
ncbi:MAG: response regulator transcription factor [Clostridia bacterium]|nr:response regulator transcription factor [Clostridia bacterium]